jgi:ureidoglycolate hydrolase
MEEIKLPRQVIDRLEHRWASRLQEDAKAWSGERGRSVRLRQVQRCARHPCHRQTFSPCCGCA